MYIGQNPLSSQLKPEPLWFPVPFPPFAQVQSLTLLAYAKAMGAVTDDFLAFTSKYGFEERRALDAGLKSAACEI